MAKSIYNVPEHQASNTYLKNAIVFTQSSTLGEMFPRI